MVPIIVFLLVMVLVTVGVVALRAVANWLPDPLVDNSLVERGAEQGTLFVLVHGVGGSPEDWKSASHELKPYGDVLSVRYSRSGLSNADADEVSFKLSEAVQAVWKGKNYERVVLVGHSGGALIARKAFLYGCGGAKTRDGNAPPRAEWARRVKRVVLMAGMNRGWDISRRKPMDMSLGRYLYYWLGPLVGEWTGTGKLIRAMETGTPFVSNLRLEWMRWYLRDDAEPKPHVVQLLGDIDDVVSDEDNQDLRATSSTAEYFTWLRVRGSGHLDIIDFENETSAGGQKSLGDYRRDKFLLAATQDIQEVQRENEGQAFQTDPQVKHVIFILHGIRDLGDWSAAFETALRERFRKQKENDNDKLAIASIRYGYFGMGPFLLRSDRQKYVRWFMDEYTETLARYPKHTRIDFVGHSNGTYLLASALQRYRSLEVDRIVLGGSVVRKDYDWDRLLANNQVKSVANYVACDDKVVALLPRFFETWPGSCLNDDLGSAGFNGFDSPNVDNVKFITGGHGAMFHHIPAIAEFVMPPDDGPIRRESHGGSQYVKKPNSYSYALLKNASDWGCWLLWSLAAVLLVFIGFYLRQFGLPVLAVYIVILLWILYHY